MKPAQGLCNEAVLVQVRTQLLHHRPHGAQVGLGGDRPDSDPVVDLRHAHQP